MKTSGDGLAAALPQVAQADPGVDEDGDDSRLEDGEDQREEVEARPDHQHGPRPVPDADGPQAQGDLVADLVELADSSAAPAHCPVRRSRRDGIVDGRCVGVSARHIDQPAGDIGYVETRRSPRDSTDGLPDQGMRREERAHQAIDGLRLVLEEQVPGLVEAVDLGRWESPHPLVEHRLVEHEVRMPQAISIGMPASKWQPIPRARRSGS